MPDIGPNSPGRAGSKPKPAPTPTPAPVKPKPAGKTPAVHITINPNGTVIVTTTEKGLPGFIPGNPGEYSRMYSVANAQQFAWDLISDKVVGWTADQAVSYFNQHTDNGKNFHPTADVVAVAQQDAQTRHTALTQQSQTPPPAATPAPAASAPTPTATPDPALTVSPTGPPPAPAAPSSPAAADPLANLSDDQIVSAVQSQYGYAAWVLNDPELRPIFIQAVRGQWSDQTLQGALTKTHWWANNNSAQRDWMNWTAQAGPAEVQSKINDYARQVQLVAHKLGVNASWNVDQAIASTLLGDLGESKINEDHINSALLAWAQQGQPQPTSPSNLGANYAPDASWAKMVSGKYVDAKTGNLAYFGPEGEPGAAWDPSKPLAPGWMVATMPDGRMVMYNPENFKFASGQQNAGALQSGQNNNALNNGAQGAIQSSELTLRKDAADWMIPVSDGMLQQWATWIATGQKTEEDFNAFAQPIAEGLFPTLATQIKKGVKPSTLFDPYKQMAARTLEVSPDSVDFTKAPYSSIINARQQDGSMAPMTLSETEQYLRGLPQWQQTQQAHSAYSNTALSILKTFGAIGQGYDLSGIGTSTAVA